MTELLKKPEITSMKTGEMSDASREYYLTLIKEYCSRDNVCCEPWV